MFQFSASFATAAGVTATNTATGFLASDSKDRLAPFRPWRAASYAGDLTLTHDLGSLKDLWGVGLWHCNAPQVKLALSTNGSSWVGLPGQSVDTLYTLQRDFDVYKYFVGFASAQNYRHVRVTIPGGQTLNADVPFMQDVSLPEIGTLFICTALTTVAVNPNGGINMIPDSGEDEIQNSANVGEIIRRRYPRVTLDFDVKDLSRAERAAWENVLALGRSTPVLWLFNDGYPQEMYWTRFTGQVRVRDSFDRRTINSSWRTLG